MLDPSTIRGEVIADLLEQLDQCGLEVNLFWCPTDIGVPMFTCYVLDRRPGAGAYEGHGCHLDPEIAMVRAVTEAVQARTIFIAGARDDLMRSTYAVLKRTRLTRHDFEQQSVVVAWDDLPDRDTGTFHGDVRVMLDALAAAGFERVLARELDAREFEVAVARVIVPGLEPYLFSWSAYGDRALRFDASAYLP